MKDIKEVMEDPIKSKIMSFSAYKPNIHVNELKKLDIQSEETQKALDFLTSSNFLTKQGNYYKKTAKGGKVAYALKEYEETSESLTGIDINTKISSSNFILDIGRGGGVHLSELGRYSANTIGIDVDPEFLYIAKLKSGAKLTRADAHFLPFKSNIFDLVLCYLVLPYVSDEDRVMAEASRVLKTNGTISLSVHGLGYYHRVIFGKQRRRGLKEKLGAGLAILNTFVYWLTNKTLRFKGHSIATFQTDKGTSKILKRYKIETIKSEMPQGEFLSFPVFIRLVGKKK